MKDDKILLGNKGDILITDEIEPQIEVYKPTIMIARKMKRGSKYTSHQGSKEKLRRLRQLGK